MDLLVLLLVLLFIAAIFGGVFVHPLLFLFLVLIVIVFASRGRYY